MNVNRRNILKSAGAVMGAKFFNSATAEAQRGPGKLPLSRPNLLVFMTDDHAQWLQEIYGNTEVQTPNMTRLAQSGVHMTNAFTTCPVCSPSRASFFTGCMPSQHGIHDWIEESKASYAYPWLKGQTLISEILKDAGYHTGLVGKWHCGQDRYPHPGFDEWFTFWGTQYPHDGEQNLSDNGKQYQIGGFQSNIFSDRAITFLQNHHRNEAQTQKPFFLFVSFTDTHTPHAQMPQALLAKYKDATFRDIPIENWASCHGRDGTPVDMNPAEEREIRSQYYAAATSVDLHVGRIIDELTSLGMLDDTLIVYTSDHGLNAGHHGMWEKGNASSPQNFFDESIRVPCTISWPKGGVPCGLALDIPVNHCDLYATLLEVAKATPSSVVAKTINSPGRSYAGHLRGEASDTWRNGIICEYGNARMLRRDGYKLILRYPYQGANWISEFYDLRQDPRETVNLFPNLTLQQAHIVDAMKSDIDAYFRIYTVPERDGLHMETQFHSSDIEPWLRRFPSNNH